MKVRAVVLAAAVLLLAAGCGGRARRPATVPAAPLPVVSIMGPARLSAPQLAAWFHRRDAGIPGRYLAAVPVETLIGYYLEEGDAEGVAGDVAFVQAIVETGWFRYPGRVRAEDHNFAGIGAVGGRSRGAAFPDARTGVRAQVQHLRAYADVSAHACTAPPLRNPCADPRFDLVQPKGRAPSWNDLGRGNWAASPSYASTILALYAEALAAAGLRPPPLTPGPLGILHISAFK